MKEEVKKVMTVDEATDIVSEVIIRIMNALPDPTDTNGIAISHLEKALESLERIDGELAEFQYEYHRYIEKRDIKEVSALPDAYKYYGLRQSEIFEDRDANWLI